MARDVTPPRCGCCPTATITPGLRCPSRPACWCRPGSSRLLMQGAVGGEAGDRRRAVHRRHRAGDPHPTGAADRTEHRPGQGRRGRSLHGDDRQPGRQRVAPGDPVRSRSGGSWCGSSSRRRCCPIAAGADRPGSCAGGGTDTGTRSAVHPQSHGHRGRRRRDGRRHGDSRADGGGGGPADAAGGAQPAAGQGQRHRHGRRHHRQPQGHPDPPGLPRRPRPRTGRALLLLAAVDRRPAGRTRAGQGAGRGTATGGRPGGQPDSDGARHPPRAPPTSRRP